jgi:hypothetical protein
MGAPLVLGDGTAIDRIEEGSRVTLPCGAVVEGRPHQTASYRATATRLGYGSDTGAMCRDHDPLHAILCDWLGLTSQALRQAAGLPFDGEIAAAEEEAALAVQRFLRLAGAALPGVSRGVTLGLAAIAANWLYLGCS